MIRELDRVVLTADLPEHDLRSGDLGTVVLVHGDAAGYEVEFVTLDGETLTVVTLTHDRVRPVRQGEIAHVRMVHAA
jgi:hypothetical protein